jgi:macrolide transport system ATP-binding/permease protein
MTALAALEGFDPTNLKPIVQALGLAKTHGLGAGGVSALQGIDLSIKAGEFVAVLGRSGSGKSTLLSLLGLLDLPTGGSCFLRGCDGAALGPGERAEVRNREIGFVFQQFHLLPRLTAQENVELPLVYAGLERDERQRRAASALDAVGLADRMTHWPAQLSGGEQQRVALARAIVNRPALLLADEPTGSLDTRTGQQIMELLCRLNDAGQTIVMVTHDVELARHAHRALVMRDGAVVGEFPVRDRDEVQSPGVPASGPAPDGSRLSRVKEALSSAIRTLRANPVRSALTALGVVVGIAAVIAMVAIGDGARRQVSDQIRSLGTNLLLVLPGSSSKEGVNLGLGSRPSLTEGDAEAIESALDGALVAAPTVSGMAQLVHGSRNWSTLVGGVVPGYLTARDWRLDSGQTFTSAEVGRAAKVVLLGQTVARRLFAGDDPLGRTLRIGNTPFRVTGVLAAKGQDAASGRDQDDVVLVPLTTAKLRVLGRRGIDRRSVDFIVIKAEDGALDELSDQVTRLLRDRHRIQPGAEDDFLLRDPAASLQARDESLRSLTYLLLAVAAVALLVGGIGIMNIMLFSTVERRSEIALRMAVGAAPRDIRTQFLIEALALCLLGSIAGVVLGAGAAGVIAELSGWPVLVRPHAILLAVAFASLTGLFFGWYPARKASLMSAIHGALAR